MEKILRASMDQTNPSSWEDALQLTVYNYNRSLNRSIDMSPYQLTFGQVPWLKDSPAARILQHKSLAEHIEEIQAFQDYAMHKAVEAHTSLVEQRIEQGSVILPVFDIGEMVSVLTPGDSKTDLQ
jgi:hypothetical protein